MELKEEYFSKKQWEIITSKIKYKQVIASAGSGKTRTVIGSALYWLEENHTNTVLLLSFTRKACGELMERIPDSYKTHIEVCTFHSFCYRYLKTYHPIYSKLTFSILEEKEKIAFLENLLRKNPKITYGIPYVVLIRNIHKIHKYIPDLYQYLTRELKKFKEQHALLEYEDLISIVLEGLRNQEEWTYPLIQNYKRIIVDEFQDTDPGQLTFLRLIQPEHLLVVGDDWQAIYGFRGATLEPFLNFRTYFQNTKLFKLDENYRSLQKIVKASNFVISWASKKISKKVKSIRGNGINVPLLAIHSKTKNFYEKVIKIIHDYNAMLLVRSNYRKYFWIQNGLRVSNIMTIHKSKGLEFSIVFLDLEAGWSGEAFLTDEEIRVAYVGISRAENICVIIYGEKKEEQLESFLFETLFYKISKLTSLECLKKYLDKEKSLYNLAVV